MTKNKTNDKLVFWKRILRSKVFLVFAIVLLLVLALFLGKVVHRKYEVAQEIKAIQDHKEDLVKENERLRDLLEYLKTDAYKDKVARSDLGLQQEGETVVVISEGDEVVKQEEELVKTSQDDEPVAYVPTYKKWWNYFFATDVEDEESEV